MTHDAETLVLRAVLGALLAFIVGNGTSYLIFGLHAASKADVDRLEQGQHGIEQRLGERIQSLEQTVNEMKGVLRGKGIDNGQ
jgi:hypothetical protein